MTGLEKWINAASLKHLTFELEQHRKNVPRLPSEMAAYRQTTDELLARLKLHTVVMKGKLPKIL